MPTKGCALQTAFPDQAAKTIRNQLKKQRRLFNPLFSCQDLNSVNREVHAFFVEPAPVPMRLPIRRSLSQDDSQSTHVQ